MYFFFYLYLISVGNNRDVRPGLAAVRNDATCQNVAMYLVWVVSHAREIKVLVKKKTFTNLFSTF
jgi:hypothetical protein